MCSTSSFQNKKFVSISQQVSLLILPKRDFKKYCSRADNEVHKYFSIKTEEKIDYETYPNVCNDVCKNLQWKEKIESHQSINN